MPEEIVLILPAPVVRDEMGSFQHPDMPDFDEGEGQARSVKGSDHFWSALQPASGSSPSPRRIPSAFIFL